MVFFSEVFDAMFRLCADSEINVQNAVQFLDNLVKVGPRMTLALASTLALARAAGFTAASATASSCTLAVALAAACLLNDQPSCVLLGSAWVLSSVLMRMC